MKRFIIPTLLLACALATSCNTTKKLYEAREYDQVIMRTARKICSGKIKPSDVEMVAASYHQANQADHGRILALKATGAPDIWPEVFERYCSMKGRCDALACFPDNLKKHINYTALNLDDELKTSQNKAEAYLSAKIQQTLDGNTPDLDKADRLIRDLERVNRDNSNINNFKLKSMARRYGDISKLMHIEVFERQVSPNRDETVTFKESNGNLTATVTDHKLSKSATIKGKVNFIDPKSKRMVFSYPYEVTSLFEHNFTTVEGSREACSEQTLERLKQQPAPFPTDESLLKDAEQQLINLVYQKIQ